MRRPTEIERLRELRRLLEDYALDHRRKFSFEISRAIDLAILLIEERTNPAIRKKAA